MKIKCPWCSREVGVSKHQHLVNHKSMGFLCDGSGKSKKIVSVVVKDMETTTQVMREASRQYIFSEGRTLQKEEC